MFESEASTSQESQKWTHWRKHFFYKWRNAIAPRVRTAKRNMREVDTFDVPTGEMMTKFNCYINDNLNCLLKNEINDYPEYLKLARFTLTRITTFNKRRGQEVARMTLKQYDQRVKSSSGASVSNIKMTKLEAEISKFTEVVTVKGKSAKNEVVYAILQPNCVKAVEKLLEARKKLKNLEGNDYVFAISGEKKFHLPGSRTIRYIAKLAEVDPLEAFTAGKLRKYISTDMVWMNLDQHQKRLLASQLGHILSMHDNVYDENMRSAVSKLHKIPALLCAYEAGLALSKPAADVTDEDVLKYINATIKKDDSQKKKIKPSSDTQQEKFQGIDQAEMSDVSENERDCVEATTHEAAESPESDVSENEPDCVEATTHEAAKTPESNNCVKATKHKKLKRPKSNKNGNSSSNRPKMQYWSAEIKKIFKQTFAQEFKDLQKSIQNEKVEKFQRIISEKCSRELSIGSIKGTICHERRKLGKK